MVIIHYFLYAFNNVIDFFLIDEWVQWNTQDPIR